MKKIILSMCLLAAAMMGTTASAKTFGWGVTAGMNVSKIDWDDLEGTKPEADNGWYLGVTGMVSLPIVGFGVDGSIVYSQEAVDPGVKGVDSEMANYISVPVHLRYDFNLPAVNKVVVPFVMAGPQFNFAISDIDFEQEIGGLKTKEVMEKANNWRLDLGVGAILLNHLQVTYSYGIPMGQTEAKIKTGTAIEAVQKYKLGAHRVGVAYYF